MMHYLNLIVSFSYLLFSALVALRMTCKGYWVKKYQKRNGLKRLKKSASHWYLVNKNVCLIIIVNEYFSFCKI